MMTLASRYVAISALQAMVLVSAALTCLFSLLEFVEQLASVGQGSYHVIDAFIYVALTVPSRLLQVTPVSMLLGSLLALSGLSRNIELTAMLSLGIPERRIIGAVLALAAPAIILAFLTAEFIIPPAEQLAQSLRASALASSSDASNEQSSFWAQSHHQYLNVQQFRRKGTPIGIDIYDFADDGSLERAIHASRADIKPDGTWLLGNVTRTSIEDFQMRTEHFAAMPWHSFIPLQQMQFLTLPLDSIPPIALYRHIRDLDRQHQRNTRFRYEFWAKVAIPFSMVAMVVTAAPFVFGSVRARSTGRTLAIGVGFGIVFSLSQQILSRMGLLLHVSPAITALAPPVLVFVLSISLFRRAHR
ncbi:LPS export ABC transporter permease LptG [Lichenicola sp.]|uniref:LPS export ABC transporter permease LptG n=1 Tax=Lichenicola sp. TaxID=2804529 RepID=UPI003B00CACE